MPRDGRPVEAVLWMLLSGFSFIAVNGIVRYLGTDLPAAQSAFIRFGFGVLFLGPALWRIARIGVPEGTLRLFVGRGLVHSLAVLCWFFAMARIPVAEVTAIGYLNPVLVSLGGVVLFAEAFSIRRVMVVLAALAGAAIILRPGLRELELGHLSQLAAAVFFAGSYLYAKALSRNVDAAAVVGILSVSVTVVLLPVALWAWVPVSLTQVAWLALVAVMATLGHYCMSKAFAAAPLTVTQPVTFLQLIWASLLGATVFGEAIDPWVLIGGAVIIGAITINTLIEAREQGQRKADIPVQPNP